MYRFYVKVSSIKVFSLLLTLIGEATGTIVGICLVFYACLNYKPSYGVLLHWDFTGTLLKSKSIVKVNFHQIYQFIVQLFNS